MKVIVVILLFTWVQSKISNSYDVRAQPELNSYADYSVMNSPFCEGYKWAQQLAQVFSNILSIEIQEKMRLSGQQILECFANQNDVCKEVTLKNIMTGIQFIQKNGITTSQCYPNHYLTKPQSVCKRKCSNGDDMPNYKALLTQENDDESLCERVGNGDISGFLILKTYDGMNYYSSDNPTQMKAEGSFYGYEIAQVVGWKVLNQKINYLVRLGGIGWGYKGYGYVSSDDSELIVKKYSVDWTSSTPQL